VNYKHAALFSYMGKYGVQHRGVGGRPDGPCYGIVVVAYPMMEQGRLRGEGVVVGRGVLKQARGSCLR
jgi:hypothetical protein